MKKTDINKYFEAVGRRKTAIARIRLFQSGEGIEVNGKDYKDYFKIDRQKQSVTDSLRLTNLADQLKAVIKVRGGGLNAQAEAARHGIARALLKYREDLRKKLRKAGFLTRDPRMVERKKYGLKKARRAPQWSKR